MLNLDRGTRVFYGPDTVAGVGRDVKSPRARFKVSIFIIPRLFSWRANAAEDGHMNTSNPTYIYISIRYVFRLLDLLLASTRSVNHKQNVIQAAAGCGIPV